MIPVEVNRRVEARALVLDAIHQARLRDDKGILGRALRVDSRFPSLVTRVARSRGIDVGDDGRMRCPVSFANGGEFTDLNMTNCGPRLSSMAAGVASIADAPADAVRKLRSRSSRLSKTEQMSARVRSVVLEREPSRIRETVDYLDFDAKKSFATQLRELRSRRPRSLFRDDATGLDITEGDIQSDRYLRTVGLAIANQAARLAQERSQANLEQRQALQARVDAIDTKMTEFWTSRANDLFAVDGWDDVRYRGAFWGLGDRGERGGAATRKFNYDVELADGSLISIDVIVPHIASDDVNERIEFRRYRPQQASELIDPPEELRDQLDKIIAFHKRNNDKARQERTKLYRRMDAVAGPREEFADAVMETLVTAGVKRGELTRERIEQNWAVVDDRLVEAMQDIGPQLPQKWWDRILDSDVSVRFGNDDRSTARSMLNERGEWRHEIVMSSRLAQNPEQLRSVLLHELTHAIQNDPQHTEAEWAFFRRVSGDTAPTQLGEPYQDNEVGVADDFDDAYMGKVYTGLPSPTPRPAAASEITPMLVQKLYGRAGHQFGGDNDSLYWLIGMMAEV